MSCRDQPPAAFIYAKIRPVASKTFGAVRAEKLLASARFQRAGWKSRPLLHPRYGGNLPKRTFVTRLSTLDDNRRLLLARFWTIRYRQQASGARSSLQ
jgi:hypothetical protein